MLALSLFDLLAPIALKTAYADGEFIQAEREKIEAYFITDWGYSEEFVRASIPYIEAQIQTVEIEELLRPFSDYIKQNPNCDQHTIAKETLAMLSKIIKADGIVTIDEQQFSELIEQHFKVDNSFVDNLTRSIDSLRMAAGANLGQRKRKP